MSTEKKPLASWAFTLAIAIVPGAVAVLFFLAAPDGPIGGAAMLIAAAGAVIGAIQYLLTKRRA